MDRLLLLVVVASVADDGEQGDDGPPDVAEATDVSDEGEGA